MSELKPSCERCQKQLHKVEDGYHCSFNCTFCKDCTITIYKFICPNCSGELVVREGDLS